LAEAGEATKACAGAPREAGVSSQTIADVAEWPAGVVVASNASTPPGGTMSEPSNSSIAEVCTVCIATAVAVNEMFSPEPPNNAEPKRTAKLFVSPVGATLHSPFALEPDCCNVERLSGLLPVDTAPLPTLIA
jgi:hypothetical protein